MTLRAVGRPLGTRVLAVGACSLALVWCAACGSNGEDHSKSGGGDTSPRRVYGTYSAHLSGPNRGLWLLRIGRHTVSLDMPKDEGWYVDNTVKVMPGKLVLPDDPACPDEATVSDGRYKSAPARATYRWTVRRKVLQLEKVGDDCNPGAPQLNLETRWTQEDTGATDVAFQKRPPEHTRPPPAGEYSARLSPDPPSAGIWTLAFRSQEARLSDPGGNLRASSAVRISSEEVLFSNDPECPDQSNPVPGRYRWGSEDGSLAFTKVADRCGGKRHALRIAGVSWFK